jgi:diaminopimelate epimerase
MEIPVWKYSATGNNFLVLDNRELNISVEENSEVWAKLCNEDQFGADGILFLEKADNLDFQMRIVNADGGEVEMCGNGARILAHFFHTQTGKKKKSYQFETMRNTYEAWIEEDNEIRIRMTELYDIDRIDLTSFYDFKDGLYLNTGVPHCVFKVDAVDQVDVEGRGKQIGNNRRFKKGSNVNFYHVDEPGVISLRTYERGVEGETLSCGTGATAAAITASKKHDWKDEVKVKTKGGDLTVSFDPNFDNIFLKGKVEKLFTDKFSWENS